MDPQACLKHHRQHRLTEELQIRRKIEEGDLDPVTPGVLEPSQFVNHVLGAADDLDVAAEGTMRIAMRLPGNGVPRPLMRDKAFDCASIRRVDDGLVVALRLAIASRGRRSSG